MAAAEAVIPTTVIRPMRGWASLGLRELWAARELAYFLVWRDLKVRYKQTAIGVIWVLLQPLAMMAAFTVFFGMLAKMPSEGVPYPLFAYAGLLPWQVCSRSLAESANSLVADQRLITRVYFPRVLIPLATMLAALVDFAVSALVLAALMVYYGVMPTPAIVWLPALVGLMVVTALGIGLWLSALNLQFRDVRYVLPFLSQFWLFVTPVVYPSSLVPAQWRWWYGLNPMAGVVEGFRWALFGIGPGPGPLLLVSSLVAVGLLVGGLVFFQTQERTFADILGSGGR